MVVVTLNGVEILADRDPGPEKDVYSEWINLEANTLHDVVIGFTDTGGGAAARFKWMIQGTASETADGVTIEEKYFTPNAKKPEIFAWPSYVDFDDGKRTEVIGFRLSQKPSAPVTITTDNLVGNEYYEWEFCSLTFTPENWDQEQTMRVKQISATANPNDWIPVTFESTSKDSTFNELSSQVQLDSKLGSAANGRTCTAWGDVHYIVYDGDKNVNHQRPGNYHTTRTCDGDFDIQTLNNPCGGPDNTPRWQGVSCQRQVYLRYKNTVYAAFIINGQMQVGLLLEGPGDGLKITDKSESSITFETPTGIRSTIRLTKISWVDAYFDVITTTPSHLEQMMRGMCGNNDGNFNNDNLSEDVLDEWIVKDEHRLDRDGWQAVSDLNCPPSESPPLKEVDKFSPENCGVPPITVPPVTRSQLPKEIQPNPEVN
eukprot:Awhi_evm1s2482